MMRFNSTIDKALSVLSAIAIVVMMLHVVAHALMRFFLNSPLYGTNEIVAFWYLPAIALLGIPAAHLQKEHITVTLLTESLNKRIQNIFLIFACVVGALVSAGFAIYGLEEAIEKMGMGATAGVTDIITWPIYFLVPVCFALLAVLYVLDIVVMTRTGDPDIDTRTGEHVEHDPLDSSAI